MRLAAIRNPAKWERHLAMMQKRFIQEFRRPCDSKGIFVLGKQRSGTSMLMRTFHRHSDLLVFDEHRDNAAFEEYRLRGADRVRRLIEQAHFPAVCFKPVCDSHRIRELYSAFPDGYFIWIYRDYRDVANSSLRKFSSATRAIHKICTGQPGGGWFQEGISPHVSDVLRQAYRPTLSAFDLACLAWWARNQIILESGLTGQPNVTLLKYEALVREPELVLKWLFARIGIGYRDRVGRIITARSIGRHAAPEIDARVQELCSTALAALDAAFQAQGPPGVGMATAEPVAEATERSGVQLQ